MIRNILLFGFVWLVLSSCFKEDDPLPAYPMQTTTIEMGKYYRYQVYFNLVENQQVSTNDKSDFDLGFECADSAWHITLNSAAFMMAASSGSSDFYQVPDTTGFDWRFDRSDGNPDSTAIGTWLSINGNDTVYPGVVYVINRGYDHLGNLRGLRKIVFTHVDSVSYSFRSANLNGENEKETTILKSKNIRHTFFSFEQGGFQLDLEPLPESWDLLFTQYTTMLFTNEGIEYPYLVTGVLSNFGNLFMAVDSLTDYSSIDIRSVKSYSFTEARDFIGYDWKDLKGDVNTGNVYYEIVPNRTYLIRTHQGLFFKLRFTSFYSPEGEKGYPTFQYDVL